jgi:hypothetical protein
MDLTKTIDLPSGRVATIKKLTWKEMRAAAKAQTSEQIELMKQFGGELIAALRSGTSEEQTEDTLDRAERLQRAQRRKPSQYDQELVLKAGVLSIAGEDLTSVDTLSPAEADLLHEAIVTYAWEVLPAKNG